MVGNWYNLVGNWYSPKTLNPRCSRSYTHFLKTYKEDKEKKNYKLDKVYKKKMVV
jgi:hypothetical protein